MKKKTCLNGLWHFSYLSDNIMNIPQNWDETKIKVPSPFNINSFSRGYHKSIANDDFYVSGADFCLYPEYPEEWDNSDIGFYKRKILIEASEEKSRYFLRFDAVAFRSIFYFNGHKVHESYEAFLPIEFEVTDYINTGSGNTLVVACQSSQPLRYNVDGKEYIDYPYGSFWGKHVAGIWQDVWLIERPLEYIADIYYHADVYKNILHIECSLVGGENAQIEVSASEHKKNTFKSLAQIDSDCLSIDYVYEEGDFRLWDTDSPNLYDIKLELTRDGNSIDTECVKVGFRTFHLHDKRFMLNGRYINLKNDSWHYMGYSVQTLEYARSYYQMAKEVGINIVRLHAQPYPEFFLDVADEMGMLIVSESCFWASECMFSYNDKLFENAAAHVKRLVLRERTHPSVVMYSPENECIPAYKVIGSKHIKSIEDLENKVYALIPEILKLDSSRLISCDGSGDLGGRLQINSLHYPGYDCPTHREKVITIGEMGSMYYSTPDSVTDRIGEEALLSFDGRLKAVALDAYNNLIGQRKWASQICVFNIIWYGLEPLNFDDQIHTYDDYETAGIKPTRTTLYLRTLNAGVSESLPPYIPNPVCSLTKKAYKDICFYIENLSSNVYSGSETGFTISVFNDGCEDKTFIFHAKLINNQCTEWSYDFQIMVKSCQNAEVNVSLNTGNADKKAVKRLEIDMICDEKVMHSDNAIMNVYEKSLLLSNIEKLADDYCFIVVNMFDENYSSYLNKMMIKNIFCSATDDNFQLGLSYDACSFCEYIDFNAVPLLFMGNGNPVAMLLPGSNKVVLSIDLFELAKHEPSAALALIAMQELLSKTDTREPESAYVYAGSDSGIVKLLKSIHCNFELIDENMLDSLLEHKNDRVLIVDGGNDISFLRKVSFANFSDVLICGASVVPERFSYDFQITEKNAFHLRANKDNIFASMVYSNNLYGLSANKEVKLASRLLECKNKSNIVLGIPNIDWRMWNFNAEHIKTVSIKKADNLDNTRFSAISQYNTAGSRIYFSQLSFDFNSVILKNLYVRLLTHLNVKVTPKKSGDLDKLFADGIYIGRLNKALYKKLCSHEQIHALTPRLNYTDCGRPWVKKILPLMEKNSAAAFYAYSPSDRTDLLRNPDTVSMRIESNNALSVFLNKECVYQGKGTVIDSIKLRAGFNQIVIAAKEEQPFPNVSFIRYDNSEIDLRFSLEVDNYESVLLTNAFCESNVSSENICKITSKSEFWLSDCDQYPGMEIKIRLEESRPVNSLFFKCVTKDFSYFVYTPKQFEILAGDSDDNLRPVYSSFKEEFMSYEDGKVFVSFDKVKYKTYVIRLVHVALKPFVVSDMMLLNYESEK